MSINIKPLLGNYILEPAVYAASAAIISSPLGSLGAAIFAASNITMRTLMDLTPSTPSPFDNSYLIIADKIAKFAVANILGYQTAAAFGVNISVRAVVALHITSISTGLCIGLLAAVIGGLVVGIFQKYISTHQPAGAS